MIDWTAVEAWPLAEAIRRSVWAFPLIETVHIAAFAVLVGSLVVLELRVFGAQPGLSHVALGRLVVRIALVALPRPRWRGRCSSSRTPHRSPPTRHSG
jgi:hypothetical protein